MTAPELSPEERAVVERFEAAPDLFLEESCGVEARDVHGHTVCDRECGHEGAHGGPSVAGLRLRWSGAA